MSYTIAVLLEITLTVSLIHSQIINGNGYAPLLYIPLTAAIYLLLGRKQAMAAALTGISGYILLIYYSRNPFLLDGILANQILEEIITSLSTIIIIVLFINIWKKSQKHINHLIDDLKGSHKKLDDILESISDAFISMDMDWNIIYINAQAEKILRKRRRALMGKCAVKFFPQEIVDKFMSECERAIEAQNTIEFDLYHPPFKQWFTVKAYPSSDGVSVYICDKTSQKVAEDALRASQENYKFLVENQTDLVVKVDTENRFMFVSPSYCNLFGKSEDELLGKSFAPMVHKDDIDHTLNAMKALYRPPYTAYMEQRVFTKYGWRWMGWADKAVFDDDNQITAIVGVGRDITDRKQIDQALMLSEKKYHLLFENMNEWYAIKELIYDKNGIPVDWAFSEVNTAFAEAIQMPKQEIIGKRATEIYNTPTAPQPFLDNYIQLMKTGTPIQFEGYIPTIDKHLLASAFPLDNNHMAAVFIDITALKLAEKHKQEFFSRTILASTEGKLHIIDRDEIDKITGNTLATWEMTDPGVLSAIRHQAADLAEKAGLSKERIYDFELCIGEATTNALKHANGGTASFHRLDDSILFKVSDNGKGIETLNIPDIALKRNYSTAGTLGMGYKAMLKFADKLYLATDDNGTVLVIKMQFSPESNFPLYGV